MPDYYIGGRRLDETGAAYVSGISRTLLTDRGGPNQRLRVDVGQTGFFAGREARTFKELNIAASGSYTMKFVSPVNFIVQLIEIAIESGTIRYESFAAGTEGGSYSETLPIILTNLMTERPTPLYVPLVAITAGGTITGGTALDITRIKANANTNQATSVGNTEDNVRGYPAGTYYVRLSNLSGTDAAVGTVKLRWEERLPPV